MKPRISSCILAVLAMAACESITENPQLVEMGTSLSGGRVRPDSVTSDGTGLFRGTLSSEETFTYTMTFAGLSSAANGAHIHGPADTNEVAGIIVDLGALPDGSTGTITLGDVTGEAAGTVDLALPVTTVISGDSLHALLRAGKVYVDVHTTDHPNGELRGNLLRN